MYAVIQTGGKQYRVSPGDLLEVELLDIEAGKEVVFEEILMVSGDQMVVGTPKVDGAKVVGEVVEHGKGDKVIIFKYKRRKHYQRKRGHRQNFTAVKIKGIMVGDKELGESPDAVKPAVKPAKKAAKQPAEKQAEPAAEKSE